MDKDKLFFQTSFEDISKTEKLCLWLICIWLCLFGAYFFWESYYFGSYAKIINSLVINFGVFVFLVMSFFDRRRRKLWCINKNIFWSIFSLALFCLHGFCFTGDGIVWSRFFAQGKFFLIIFALMLMPDYRRRFIFDKTAKLYAIIVIPSILAYVFYLAGIEIPYRELASTHVLKNAAGVFYRMYPCGLVLSNTVGEGLRPCGIFDEPGVIGTVLAFLFCGGYKTLGKKWLTLIFVEGLLSTSMAFYMMIFIFYFVKFAEHDWKMAMCFLVVIIMGLAVFKNIEIENDFLVRQQNRIDFSSPFLIRDNRSTLEFDKYFSDFVDNLDYNTFMGNGMDWYIGSDAADTGSYSLKTMIFSYGFLGILEWSLFFWFMTLFFGINRYSLPFLIIFVASLYQRPDIMSIQAMIIFGTAMTTLSWYCRKEFIKK